MAMLAGCAYPPTHGIFQAGGQAPIYPNKPHLARRGERRNLSPAGAASYLERPTLKGCCMSGVNYEAWDSILSCDSIQAYQAAYLWCDIDPPRENDIKNMPGIVNSILDTIKRKICSTPERFRKKEEGDYVMVGASMFDDVSRVELISLAELMRVKPKFLYPDTRGMVSNQNRETFCQNNDFFAPDLDIAIKAYTAIFIDDGHKPNIAPLKQIKEWLLKNFPDDTTETSRERIAQVINPFKKGGPPSETRKAAKPRKKLAPL